MKKTCIACNGKGKQTQLGTGYFIPCRICKGKKYVDIPEGTDICPDCFGTGILLHAIFPTNKLNFYHEIPCPNCAGRGFVNP